MARGTFWKPAAAVASFLTRSRRDVKPRGNVFLEVVPSFSGMVFRCGEGTFWKPAAAVALFLTRSTRDVKPRDNVFFWKSFRPSVAWCFGVARGTFWRPAAAVALWIAGLERLSSGISEGTFRPPGNLFLRLILRHFRHEIRWCFAVSAVF